MHPQMIVGVKSFKVPEEKNFQVKNRKGDRISIQLELKKYNQRKDDVVVVKFRLKNNKQWNAAFVCGEYASALNKYYYSYSQ